MNAKEFIKKFGWEKAISVRNDFRDGFYLFSLTGGYVDRIAGFQLSEYIDAYELVNSYGGLHGFKTYCNGDFSDQDLQAISLVEEINE